MSQHNIPRTALVACSRLVDFAGAEIASLEIAQVLNDLGVKVKLAALEIGPAIEDEIKLLGIECVDLSVSSLRGAEFDLIWVSHYVVAYHLLASDGVRAKTGVYSSLSHFEPLEAPPLPSLLFSRYVVNSDENLLDFLTRYPDLGGRVNVFPNAATASFLNSYRETIDNEIRSIAVISNHQPREVNNLIELLKKNGVEVDLIGIQGEALRVTPEVLSCYSAIITIGKTVQYCLVTGTPVFCYDHFGGPGWITMESFDAAFRKNFSGRCTPLRRTSESIYSEIFAGFSTVLNQRELLKGLARARFDLKENLLDVLSDASASPLLVTLSETETQVLSRESRLFVNQRQVIRNYQQAVIEREGQIANLSQAVADREGQIAALNEVVTDREGQIASLVGAIEEIYRSNIWRLLKPVRWYGRQRQRLGSNWRARYRQLLERSRFVLRQEGVLAFFRRMAGYIGRSLRRRWAMQRIERYFPAQKDFVPPLVTFIIPIYDRTSVLREAICSALGQSLQVFEVILVTDGSPPATLSVVEEFRADPRVRIFNYPVSSGNAVRGRNKGILEARGRYIAFLDSDDIAAPDRLEVCLPLLESGRADVVYGAWRAKLDGTRQVDGLADGQVVYSPDCDLEMLRKVCVPCQSTVMVRRELLLKAGFLKQSMKYREDHELWARLAYHGARFKALPHVLTDLRLHAGNNELNFKANDAHWERLLGEEYLRPGLRPRKIAFLLGCLGISGGAAVVLRHVSLLLDQGHDVFVINVSGQGDLAWFGDPAIRVFGLDQLDRCGIDNIDLLFATFWTTVELLERIPALRKLYFVQSDERLFYDEPAVQAQVAATYRGAYEYVAIARWICDMLRDEFGQEQVHYVPNGLDLQMFYPGSPLQEKNPLRPRVLVEGPISVPFKGVADACAALRDLDCEVWIVSSSGRPEEHWRYERSFEAVDHAQMRQIYASCDILLKMSRVESFAYPPLEAMACGCAVVLGEVRGGIEYAEDGVNVLKVAAGDINQARAAVQRLLDDKSLRERLQAAGFLTAKSWSWEASREAMEEVLENTQDDVQVTLIPS
jgi:glycosyltransferase involved in cell wall biosynthesis